MNTSTPVSENQDLPPSPVEALKSSSRGLRGGIAEFLTGAEELFDEAGKQLL